MAFQSRNGGGSNGPLPPRQNAAFEVVSYDVKDRYKPSPDDTFKGYLLTEAFGQPAGTEMTFKQGRLPERGLTIHSMLYGSSKPRLEPTQINGQGIAEGAYYDRRSGMVVMNWLTVKVREPNSIDQLLYGQYFSVDSERTSDRGFKTQARYMYDVTNAREIADVTPEAILAVVAGHLATPATQLGGEPGFVLRGIDQDRFEDEAFQATRFTLPRVEVSEGVYRSATPEEAIARFAENQYYQEFAKNLADPEDPVKNPFIEIIPTVRIRTGQDSLPANREKNKDDSTFFKLELEPINPDPQKKRFAHLIARGHAHIRYAEPKAENQEGSFFSTLTLPMQRQAPLYALAEIPTANLRPDIAEFFSARAEARGLKVDPPQSREPRAAAPAAAEDAPSASGPRP